MMMIEIRTYQKREMSVLERINQKETVYICFDDDCNVLFGTPSKYQAIIYCRLNNCNYSTHPPKCYTED
jgi:hypothetical protein